MHQAKTDPIMRTSHPAAWVAAIAAMAIAAVASGSCFFSSATNVCENGRRCNPGQVCAPNQDICVDIDGCGNGRVDPGEICDDGNILDGDGCSASCESNETCGNGKTDTINPENPKETCDDGNKMAGDGCSPQCFLELCGNMATDHGEVCDDGNTTPGDGCSSDCTSNEACGNGITDNEPSTLLQEDCDPQDLFPLPAQNTETCDSDCTSPLCGDGHFNPNYQFADDSGSSRKEECDTGADSASCDEDCTFAICGDGHLNMMAEEQCDTGPQNSNQPDRACRTDCRKQFCGDGIIDPAHNELCDPEGQDIRDCDSDCTEVQCGDLHINMMAGEQCDDGDTLNNDDCVDGCQEARCGDGFIRTMGDNPEECDPMSSNNRCSGCTMDCLCII